MGFRMFIPRGSSSRIVEAVRRGVSRRPWAKARTVMDWASQKKETWFGLEGFFLFLPNLLACTCDYSYLFLLGQNTTTWGIYNPKNTYHAVCCSGWLSMLNCGKRSHAVSFIGVQVLSAVPCSTGVWKGRRHSKVVHAMVPDYTSGDVRPEELRSKAMRVVHFYGHSGRLATSFCLHEIDG